MHVMPESMILRLREALIGVSERWFPDDPFPCFCVRSVFDVHDGVHDEWCEDARCALSESAEVSGARLCD
jgi:hypothetical protein